MTDQAYPPEPWHLAGSAHVTIWRVPVGAVPSLPCGVRLLSLRGTAVALTAFVSYSEAGVMAYDELLAGVVVRHGRRIGLSITDIWVDSVASRTGGRELWGIPKELADFDGLAARTPEGPVASARFAPRRGPAVRLPWALPGSVLQERRGRTVVSPVAARGRVRFARGDWELDPVGPLAWLGGADAMTSMTVQDFRMRFG